LGKKQHLFITANLFENYLIFKTTNEQTVK